MYNQKKKILEEIIIFEINSQIIKSQENMAWAYCYKLIANY